MPGEVLAADSADLRRWRPSLAQQQNRYFAIAIAETRPGRPRIAHGDIENLGGVRFRPVVTEQVFIAGAEALVHQFQLSDHSFLRR